MGPDRSPSFIRISESINVTIADIEFINAYKIYFWSPLIKDSKNIFNEKKGIEKLKK